YQRLKSSSATSRIFFSLSFVQLPLSPVCTLRRLFSVFSISHFSDTLWSRGREWQFVTIASCNKATETEDVQELEVQDNADDGIKVEAGEDSCGDGKADFDESSISPIINSLQLYKEAIRNNEESKIAEVEALLKSIVDEKNDLEKEVISLTAELSAEKERIIRTRADFSNFQKRTEREWLSLVTSVQGEVVENLLPVLDNFERAKAQIKAEAEAEAEEKINNSYQSVCKQFVEILSSIGVVPVQTVGKPFDPLVMAVCFNLIPMLLVG
ncbi:hypothetical protein Ancab_033214, partial [Ancistrocladus abbreviatus]